MKNLLVFDFGGTTIKYSLFSGGKLSTVKHFPTPLTWEETKKKMDVIKADYEQIQKIEGLAFSFPGNVDHQKGVIIGHSKIKYIHHFPIKKDLETHYQLPVSMANDANCAALAECWTGVATGKNNVLFIVVGTDIGGSVVIDGKVQFGAHLFCGNFGDAIVGEKKDGTPIRLGDDGSSVQMARRYCQRKGVDEKTFSGKDVFEFAKQGDDLAVEMVASFYKYLSRGLFNLQMNFDPEMMIIGGGISANSDIIQELELKTNQLIHKKIKDFSAKIVPCQHQNDANLLGAVKNFLDEYEVKQD